MRIIIIVIAPKTGFPEPFRDFPLFSINRRGFTREASDARPPFFDKLSCDFLLGYKTQALNMPTTKKFGIKKHRKRQ